MPYIYIVGLFNFEPLFEVIDFKATVDMFASIELRLCALIASRRDTFLLADELELESLNVPIMEIEALIDLISATGLSLLIGSVELADLKPTESFDSSID